jgi:hypothetical protein
LPQLILVPHQLMQVPQHHSLLKSLNKYFALYYTIPPLADSVGRIIFIVQCI